MTTEAERRYEIDNLLASNRLEGIELDAEVLALLNRYVVAELSWAQVLELWDVRLAAELATYERLPVAPS
jgi:hypothetical protein